MNYWLIPLFFCLLVCLTTFITGWVYYDKNAKTNSADMAKVNTTVWMAVLCVLAAVSICFLGLKAMAHKPSPETPAEYHNDALHQSKIAGAAAAKAENAQLKAVSAALTSRGASKPLKAPNTTYAS